MSFVPVTNQHSRPGSYYTTFAVLRAAGYLSEPVPELTLELPPGWRPPSQTASTLLSVLITIQARRQAGGAA